MDFNFVKTSAITGMKLETHKEGKSIANTNLSRQTVGSMMHAAVYAYPDIAFVTNKLPQYNAEPSAAYMYTATQFQ
jgi:hypothetical protein